MQDLEDRFARQVRLTEVGPEGQERLCRARVVVHGSDESGESAFVQADYLRRAGVACVEMTSEGAPPPFAHAAVFEHPLARDLGAGAWRALHQIREILGLRAP